MDADKKHSTLNNLHTRGKRVVAEITLPETMVREVMHTSGAKIHQQPQPSNMGTLRSGSINNGSHFANGITAVFIACGQDVANVAESSAGFVYGELKDNGDYYFSVTIPSLIVATPWRRHGVADAARVSGTDRLLRQGQGEKTGGNCRGDGVVRRTFTGCGDRFRSAGFRSRPVRAQQEVVGRG